MNKSARVPLPPLLNTASGAVRRLGVELEMQGLDIDALSRLVAAGFEGRIERISDYEHHVHGHPAGDWQVELDFAYLKDRGRQSREPGGLMEQLDEVTEDLLAAGSQAFVPLEIVTPPLPMDRLDELERLIVRLREAGARGTRDGFAYAFGMHLNPEMPALDTATLTRYLKAFLCLHDWLKREEKVDLLRRVTVYIDPFPVHYVRQVIQPDYWPDQDQLIDDYLDANPTRNRALDLLPLFAHLDESRVRARVDDPRIKSRPALHYRLPNCEIDNPEWYMTTAWRRWLQVEHLVADATRLDRLCAAYEGFLNRPFNRLIDDWSETLTPWLVADEDL